MRLYPQHSLSTPKILIPQLRAAWRWRRRYSFTSFVFHGCPAHDYSAVTGELKVFGFHPESSAARGRKPLFSLESWLHKDFGRPISCYHNMKLSHELRQKHRERGPRFAAGHTSRALSHRRGPRSPEHVTSVHALRTLSSRGLRRSLFIQVSHLGIT